MLPDSLAVDKEQVIDEIAAQITESEAIYAADYSGLTVAQAAALRDKLREAGVVVSEHENGVRVRYMHADIDAIGRAFDRLRPDERAILALHHVDARPVAEIARTLGIPTRVNVLVSGTGKVTGRPDTLVAQFGAALKNSVGRQFNYTFSTKLGP